MAEQIEKALSFNLYYQISYAIWFVAVTYMYLVSSADKLYKNLADDHYNYFFKSLAIQKGNFVNANRRIVAELKFDAFLPMNQFQGGHQNI